MTDPLFWLVLSFLFVTVSLTIVLAVAIPAFRELARAARSAEKLFDTLRREFPPTLESIRLTGMEISDLTDDVSEGVQSAGNVVKQVDQSLGNVRKQAQKVQSGSRNLMVGFKAAWKTFTRPQKSSTQRRSVDRLPPARPEMELGTGLAGESRANNRRLSPEELPLSHSSHPPLASNPLEFNPGVEEHLDISDPEQDHTEISSPRAANPNVNYREPRSEEVPREASREVSREP